MSTLRPYVERFPGAIVRTDTKGKSILHDVCGREKEGAEELIAFVTWLIDEKGADVESHEGNLRLTPLQCAATPEVVGLLLERGTDPRSTDNKLGDIALMRYIKCGRMACVARLLDDAEGRASVNIQLGTGTGHRALHWAARWGKEFTVPIIGLLLGAGADITLTDQCYRKTAKDFLRERDCDQKAEALALFEQVPDSLRATMLVHARRLVMASSGLSLSALSLSQASADTTTLLRVELTPLARQGRSASAGSGGGLSGGGRLNERHEDSSLHMLMAFVLGLGTGP